MAQFLVIFICMITGFSDVFNAIHQGMFINKYDAAELLRTDIDLNAINIFQSWIDFW